ncbi:hypothetical protein FRC03_009225 [Tulasnella sp. 419]|nr:hypothetical protein FRC03_009225 [Tulasnella sp. 419]
MRTGYPRFFIHKSIQKLSFICEKRFGLPNEKSILFPSSTIADACRTFIKDQHRVLNPTSPSPQIRLVQYNICPQSSTTPPPPPTSTKGENVIVPSPCDPKTTDPSNIIDLHIVFLPQEIFRIGKSFWQHVGDGISSRLAEKCLSMLNDDVSDVSNGVTTTTAPPPLSSGLGKRPPQRYSTSGFSHYGSKKGVTAPRSPPRQPAKSPPVRKSQEAEDEDSLTADATTYLEERYARNLPQSSAATAKRTLRRRIAGVLVRDDTPEVDLTLPVAKESWRGVKNVGESDVWLYPTGMSAIWHAHQLAMQWKAKEGEVGKSVCFGFPYTDTLKILQKWGPGAHFLGNGLDSDIDSQLVPILQQQQQSQPPILALFCEFPSNPLLRSPNLVRLRSLADEYGFLIVVDETIANFVNVDVLRYADIVVSSLTKVFSGETNVMGGSLVLNPNGRYYIPLKNMQQLTYEDTYFGEDAIYMERNSRDFKRRVDLINRNTALVAGWLREQCWAYKSQLDPNLSKEGFVIKDVFYPKWVTTENYDRCRIVAPDRANDEVKPVYDGGYGGLFSITFTSKLAAQSFFDALGCEKGPSLGTNFTLACPYTVLAHYTELDWAAGWGVEADLVRVSVGMEKKDVLMNWFEMAVRAAEQAVKNEQ